MATKTKAAKKASKKVTKNEKAVGTPVARDKWNYRVTTKCHQINKCFSKKRAVTARQVAEKLGISLVLVRNHIQTLLKKELIVRTDNGVVIAVE